MSEQIYRAMADQMRAAMADAPDDETAAYLDRAYADYITAARHLRVAAMHEAAARADRGLAGQHFVRGARGLSDHFKQRAEAKDAAAAHLRQMAAAGAAQAEAHYAATLDPDAESSLRQDEE